MGMPLVWQILNQGIGQKRASGLTRVAHVSRPTVHSELVNLSILFPAACLLRLSAAVHVTVRQLLVTVNIDLNSFIVSR